MMVKLSEFMFQIDWLMLRNIYTVLAEPSGYSQTPGVLELLSHFSLESEVIIFIQASVCSNRRVFWWLTPLSGKVFWRVLLTKSCLFPSKRQHVLATTLRFSSYFPSGWVETFWQFLKMNIGFLRCQCVTPAEEAHFLCSKN